MTGLRSLSLLFLLTGFTVPSSGESVQNDFVLRKEFEEMKNLVKSLQERSQIQDQRLSDLENEVTTLKSEVKQKDEIIEKMTELSKASPSENNAPQKSAIVKKRSADVNFNDRLKGKYRRIVPVPSESTIAFYAYMSSSESNPGVHHTLIYDHEVTNVGNGYNRHSGTFIAPVNGVYVFTWTTFVLNQGEYMSTEITLNSQPVGATFPDGGGDYAGVTGFVVLSMQKNDIVFTRTHTTYVPHGTIRSDYLMRSTFSGWCVSCH